MFCFFFSLLNYSDVVKEISPSDSQGGMVFSLLSHAPVRSGSDGSYRLVAFCEMEKKRKEGKAPNVVDDLVGTPSVFVRKNLCFRVNNMYIHVVV
jgi:hypothetical protein